ncbi:MAG TPA: response regulator [Coleofasciculaceae cyanobacterium]|jgi:signal transduction histidine kinase/CheY-like chemotaxis protein
MPIIANPLATDWLTQYFSIQQNSKNINKNVGNHADNISDRLLFYLNNSPQIKDISADNRQNQLLSQILNKYLTQADLDFSAKVIVINEDGLIIASNFREINNKSSFASQDVLIYLQQKFDSFSKINKAQQFDFKIKQNFLFGQVTPWQSKALGLNGLIVAIIPKTELMIDQSDEQRSLRLRYLTYLSSTVFLGILTCIWITRLIKLNQSPMPMELSHNHSDNQQIAKGDRLNERDDTSSPSREHYPALNQEDLFLQGADSEENLNLDPPLSQTDLPIAQTEKTVHNEPYELLADMSHELRSPLNAILGFVQIMEQELSITPTSRENIAIINRSGERLLGIINDVVDLAKIETNRLTLEHNNVDFYSWLDTIEQSIKLQAYDRGWEFSLIREENLPQYICIDERRLRQILRNLIDYCFKSTPTSTITLRVAYGNARQKTTVVANQQSSSKNLNVYFEVENANLQVTATELATLFNPTVRVRQEQQSQSARGSSLNLPISRRLAQLMGGDITVSNNSNLGQGIIFNLEIQTESIVAQKLQVQSGLRRIIRLESDQIEYRILIVDDSKTNRKIMSLLLEPVGFKIKEAVNGKEAVDIWLQWQPHMIWMDLRMPVMNGCEATERIRSYPHLYTPIVALTASTLEEEKLLFKAAGCDDFVGKPFSENVIFDKIAQHLGIRYVYEPIIPVTPSNFKLTAETLNVMSDRWLNQVEQAAIVLDRDLLTQLLAEIPLEHTDLKHALQKQVNDFDFDNILNLIKKS